MNKEKKSQEKNKQVLPNQGMLFLRGTVGVYLMYLAYDLLRDESKTAPRMTIIIFSIIFAVAGAVIVFGIVRTWIRGEYIGGKADTSEDEEYIEYEESLTEDDINGEEAEAIKVIDMEDSIDK